MYTPGTTPQDQLMGFLVRKFNLDSDDQLTVRTLLRQIEDGSIQNYVDRIKPEISQKVIKKHKDQMSVSQDLDRLNWANEAKKAQDWLEEQRNS